MTILAILAIVPACASLMFLVLWRWFEVWRRHPGLAYLMMFTIVAAATTAAVLGRDRLLAARIEPAWPVQAIGWLLIAATFVLAVVADRQIGLRVRSFLPLFEEGGRIELETRGAYAVVRHPIYAAGIGYQVGAFLVTGRLAILPAAVILAAGALWFTRQEERRLIERIDDPAAYQRYRERVPALLPGWRPRRPPR